MHSNDFQNCCKSRKFTNTCSFQTFRSQILFTDSGTAWLIIFVGNKAKERISKLVFQESKARQNFRKTNISYPLIRTRTCAYQGVRNVCFSEILACFAFLKHPFLDSPFYLITDDFQYVMHKPIFIFFTNHNLDFTIVSYSDWRLNKPYES